MSELAIVSPCSTCKNQRAESQDGKPACPRRQWAKLAEARQAAGENVPAALAPVLLTGTEGTDQENTDALKNPVYSDEGHHILVWVAKLADNKGTYGQDGQPISPHILSPDFDTDHIQCSQFPYTVRDTEAGYFMKGAYREGDNLEVVDLPADQMLDSAGDVTSVDPAKIGGHAQKVDFAYKFNRRKVDKALVPRGT